jgi:HSP20 family molecular chaperone IbpA
MNFVLLLLLQISATSFCAILPKSTPSNDKKSTPSDKIFSSFSGLPAHIHKNSIMPFQKFLQETLLARDMKVDVKDSKSFFDLFVSIPGVNKEDITVTRQYQELNIGVSTLLSNPKDSKKSHVLSTRLIRPKSIHLGNDADTKHTKAEYTNGVLHLKVPKLAQDKPTTISIK